MIVKCGGSGDGDGDGKGLSLRGVAVTEQSHWFER